MCAGRVMGLRGESKNVNGFNQGFCMACTGCKFTC